MKNEKYYSVDRSLLKDLEDCSKEPGSAGDDLHGLSEWALTRAYKVLPEKFTRAELENEISESTIILNIFILSDRGQLDMFWDDVDSCVRFYAGDKRLEDKLNQKAKKKNDTNRRRGKGN